MSAPGGSPGPGRPPRSPVGTPRTPAGQRVPRLPNIERGIRFPPPATMAIHGQPRGLVPSVRRILNLGNMAEDVVGPALMPLGPAAAAPRPMNMTPSRVLPPYSSELAQALGAPRRPPPPTRLPPPPPFLFPPSPSSPLSNVRTPNRSPRSRRGRKQVRKQKHTRRRR